MPKEEPSPTSSEAEASAALAASPQSSSSESSDTSGSSLSEADITPSHQNNPAIKSLGAYRLSRTTANQRHHNMSLTLPFHVDTDEQRPLAEVKIQEALREDTNQSRIDAMMLDNYLDEFQKFALPRNWQPRVRDSILASFQENMSFANWNVYIQNLNARLKNTGSEHTLSDLAIKAHFESHMRSDL
ncbi:hypothetical protein C0993_004762 [Termitomyces sp. T159_Od127]|nr:hypothetical protein C0993_004762 [Termitomyces sp. T159_Od127]